MHWNTSDNARNVIAIAALYLAVLSSANAQSAGPENLDFQRLIHKDSQALADSQTGESLNLADGALTIEQTDVVVPGNNGWDIVVKRSLSLSKGPPGATTKVLGFGSMWWMLDLPRIKTVSQLEWITGNSSQPYARCSTTSTVEATPPERFVGAPVSSSIHAFSYWAPPSLETSEDNNVLLVPLQGALLPANGHSIKWITKGRSAIACLPTIRNGPGEGYVAFTADGKKYTFDWMAKRLSYPILGLPTIEHSLYATRVEDRYGNWMEYDFEETPATYFGVRIVAIRANDGRRVDFSYNSNQLISSVAAHGRTWTYGYVDKAYGDGTRTYLSKVTLPDGSSRSFESDMLVHPYLGNVLYCASGGFPSNPNPLHYYKLTEASGLSTRYDFKAQRFARSGIPICQVGRGPIYSSVVFSLLKKTRSGPGIDSAEWQYRYESYGGHLPFTAGFNLTEMKSPNGSVQQFKYGNTFLLNEGLPIGETTFNQSGAVLRSKGYVYALAPNTFGVRVGINPRSRMSGIAPNTDFRAGYEFLDEHIRLPVETSITQDGVVFKETIEEFDALVRPTRIRRSSAPQ